MITIDNKKEKTIVLSFLLLFFIVSVFIIFNTENSFGGGDHFAHFKLANWGWKYPKLLFSHWGKPVFTILISPFAQLGINFARMYNVIAGIITAFFTWKLSKELNIKNSWVVVVLVLFTPLYFILMFTSLTEITFSLFLIISLYLFFKNKYILSVIIISFLPLIRTEGIVLFPLFIVAFILKKQWKTLPLFTVGFFLISLSGLPFHNSFWWLITEMPYKGSAADIYGHGELLHFIYRTKEILGIPIAFMFIIGLVVELTKYFRAKPVSINNQFYYLLLIPGIYFTFLAAHSYAWWKGIGNSLGLIRVIGAVTPLAALISLSGFNAILEIFSKYIRIKIILAATILLLVIDVGVTRHKYGFKMSEPQKVLVEASNYIKSNNLDKNKIYCYDSFIPYSLGIDPYDNSRCSPWGTPKVPVVSEAIPNNSIIMWDAHFGPNEGRTPLEKLINDPGLKLLKVFEPKTPFKVLGGYYYAVYIFQKQPSNRKINLDLSFDFEKNGSDEKAYSGNKSFHLKPTQTYFGIFENNINNLCTKGCYFQINGKIYSDKKFDKEKLLLVFSSEKNGKSEFYKAFSLTVTEPEEWNDFSFLISLPATLDKNNLLKIYFWNKGKTDCFLDDIKLKSMLITD